jgi:NTE family protein
MIKNLIISGGSMRGFTFLGVIKYLEEIDILQNIETFTGTSIGACLSLCLSLKFTSKELIDIFTNLDIENQRDITIDNVLKFFENYGLDDGEKIVTIFKIIIDKKIKLLKSETEITDENITFQNLFNITKNKLTIVGCCLNNMETIFYNHELTPDMKVLDALRITFSIPFIFKPVLIDGKYYVDGGITNNYPIELFDSKESIGIVSVNKNMYDLKIENIEHFLTSILWSSFYYELKKKIEMYKEITINIECEINSFDFALDKKKKKKLIEFGYNQTKEIFKKKFKDHLKVF